jgi:uncharacterized protein (DUF58 family)
VPADPSPDSSRTEIARAARLLWVRSRRQAASLIAGGYASAFRGGGIEFEESRPYAPGDDVRLLDWNATARTGQPWVKRFREERSQTVLLALDVSASMGFGTTGRSKARAAAHAVSLIAAAAGRAGDRIGLLAFADQVRVEVPPGRGRAQVWRVIRAAVGAAAAERGGTRLATAIAWALAHAGRHAVVVLLTDLRDERLFGAAEPDRSERSRLVGLARRHDVIFVAPEDPRERSLPAAGPLRLVDPEHGGRRTLLWSGRRDLRDRYAGAARARRRALGRWLRGSGMDLVWLPTEADPLHVLCRFFRERAAGPRRTA